MRKILEAEVTVEPVSFPLGGALKGEVGGDRSLVWFVVHGL